MICFTEFDMYDQAIGSRLLPFVLFGKENRNLSMSSAVGVVSGLQRNETSAPSDRQRVRRLRLLTSCSRCEIETRQIGSTRYFVRRSFLEHQHCVGAFWIEFCSPSCPGKPIQSLTRCSEPLDECVDWAEHQGARCLKS